MRKKTTEFSVVFMSSEGIEPSTNGLKGHCSAIELRARLAKHNFTTIRLMSQLIDLFILFYLV